MLKEVTVVEAFEMIEGEPNLQLLDVRSKEEFEKGSLPGFHSVPLAELSQTMPRLDGKKKTLLLCSDGSLSHQAQSMLEACGFEPAIIRGGLRDWAKIYPR